MMWAQLIKLSWDTSHYRIYWNYAILIDFIANAIHTFAEMQFIRHAMNEMSNNVDVNYKV